MILFTNRVDFLNKLMPGSHLIAVSMTGNDGQM